MALTETWLSGEIADSEFCIPGYNVFRCDRGTRNGGGVLLMVKNELDVQLLSVTSDPDGCYEGVWCKVKFFSNRCDTVGVVYRSPGSRPSLLLEELQRFSKGTHCLILGDFNCPAIDWVNNTCVAADLFTQELLSTVTDLYLHQHVNAPTRFSSMSSNILDLVLSSNESDVHDLKILPPLASSDHAVLSFYWSRYAPLPKTDKKINVWKIPFAEMRHAASKLDWVPLAFDVESLWNHISRQIRELVDQFAPKWKPRPASKGPPWFDTELRKALRQRNRAWRNFKSTGSDYNYYREIRNKSGAMKLAKRKL